MTTTFLTADNHWGHQGVCVFTKADGSKLRPWDNANDMDEAMVSLWNSTVGPNDKVYCLGDWAIRRGSIKIAERLNGDKVLIKGNHDIFKLNDYLPWFRDIRAYHVMDKCVLSHIPVHKSQAQRWRKNIHGHLHSNCVMDDTNVDEFYKCVSVEQTDFKPIAWDELRNA